MRKRGAILLAVLLLCSGFRVRAATEVPATSARSYVVMDVSSGRVLCEKEAQVKRSIASTTKLMTALAAVESTADLSKRITVRAEHQAEGSSMYLRVGEELSLEELLYGLLLASGNDAALAIAEGCAGSVESFVGWMNWKAAELGMENTHFANPNGLDAPEHYSTAYDMALLGCAVLQNDTLRTIVSTRSTQKAGRSLVNHNKLLWRYEGCTGLKTGYTDDAGRTLVSSAKREGRELVCVTLHDPSDWADHAKLLDYAFETYRDHPLARAGKRFRTLSVRGSLLPTVDVITAQAVSYPLREEETVQARVQLPDRVEAPVTAGTIAGRLLFLLGEEVIGETYLLYDRDIPDDRAEPTLLERARAFLRGEVTTAYLLPGAMLG